jgi:hypothetical protein
MRIKQIVVLACVSIWSLTGLATAQDSLPPRSEVEQVLAPLSVGEFAGAVGSHFVVEMWARNDGDQPARLFRLVSQCPGPHSCTTVAVPTAPVPPKTTLQVMPLDNGYQIKLGEFFWVDKTASPSFFLSLRVRETTRAASSAGVDIPILRESTTPGKTRQQLLNVPVEAGFRHTLRIYTLENIGDASTAPVQRLRIFDLETDALLVDDPILIYGFDGAGPTSYTIQPYPNTYTSFLDKYTALQGHSKVRVEIESNVFKFWAFVAVTNDATGETTIVAP